ncbi:DUF3037 domain-containing protein [bacterium]|nr:MAG: DUF3037 domain-containing protein [bacterium]
MSVRAGVDAAWVDYDYALVRVVPHVHLGVFVNVGVLLFAPAARYLGARLRLDPGALAGCGPDLDVDQALRSLRAIERICAGGPDSGPIGRLPPSERFHWLTAPRSAVVQTSPVHGGRARDPEAALLHVFERCVGG